MHLQAPFLVAATIIQLHLVQYIVAFRSIGYGIHHHRRMLPRRPRPVLATPSPSPSSAGATTAMSRLSAWSAVSPKILSLFAVADGAGVTDSTARAISTSAGTGTSATTTTTPALQSPAPSDQTTSPDRIRNFCIIAHIDHGKSTLADRLLEYTNTTARRHLTEQILDNLEVERERGITIKLQTGRMIHTPHGGDNNKAFVLNLIDTPGHVDFGYEVSRSLAACEGALLVVDATQGVQAQTIANAYLALDRNMTIIPVINKVDIATADPDRTAREIEDAIGISCADALRVSAKTGEGVLDLLDSIAQRLPAPHGAGDGGSKKKEDGPLSALIFDACYDKFKGVVVYFRVMEGKIRVGDRIRFLGSGSEHEVIELGVVEPPLTRPLSQLAAGEVGYLLAGVRDVAHARVGDTIALISDYKEGRAVALPGYLEPKPMVFSGLYPADPDGVAVLRDSIEKLKLNDAALSFAPEKSEAFGAGFRCGFSGLLHMEIVQERLEKEFGLDVIMTAPSVLYKVINTDGSEEYIDSPSRIPDPGRYREIHEGFARLEIITPPDCVGALMELSQSHRGQYVEMKQLSPSRVSLIYEIPIAEIIVDFFDSVKSLSHGFASMTYEDIGYRPGRLVRLDIRINGDLAPPMTSVKHADRAEEAGRAICNKLKDILPRHQFKVAIQACIGSRCVASSHISPVMKDVLAKMSGGDYSRKRKLLEKQKKGKQRLKAFGKVTLPQEAFMAVIKKN